MGLLAFAGLGLEMLLAFLIEPLIFGVGLNDFNTTQSILHWVITCVVWGISAFLLLFYARKKFALNIFENTKNIPLLNWLFCIGILLISIIISIIDWNGLKIVKEFNYNGWLKFIFQYVYYLFETVLVYLIVVFGQEAGERFFSNKLIPYGGILAALTWGIIHWLTKGSLLIGLISLVMSLLFGIVYIVTKRNPYIAFPFILLMFVL